MIDKKPTVFKSFDEWAKLGCSIKKGSSAKWVDGVALFSNAQVSPPRSTLLGSGRSFTCSESYDAWTDMCDCGDYF